MRRRAGGVGKVEATDHSVEATRFTPSFTDEAHNAGLDFSHSNGRTERRQLPETMSGGIAVLDYDGDGWFDVYAVQGGRFPPDPSLSAQGDRIYRNRGDGSFEDATVRTGISALAGGYGHGAAVGDYDNDGFPDIFVTRWRSYALYHNRGDGTFEDATASAGLAGGRDWPTSAAFADLDGDGDLDLYVCHYLTWDAEDSTLCAGLDRGYSYCSPRLFPSRPDHVFRNDGGRFVDVTSRAGVIDREGRGMGVIAADLNDDNRIDLYVVNDATPNYLFCNVGEFRFEEVGHAAGCAVSAEGVALAGMGVGCGDLDGDGRMDIVVTNFFGESTSLYRNLGRGLFADWTSQTGLRRATRDRLGFGVGLLDFNNDGRLDIATSNGHVNDVRPYAPHAMRSQLLAGLPDARLADVTDTAGPPFLSPHIGRASPQETSTMTVVSMSSS